MKATATQQAAPITLALELSAKDASDIMRFVAERALRKDAMKSFARHRRMQMRPLPGMETYETFLIAVRDALKNPELK